MSTWEKAVQGLRASALAATCTSEEYARLNALREQYQARPHCEEFGLDKHRLDFVRWLVEQGRLSEGREGT